MRQESLKFTVGLTGGIASGKTAVSNRFAEAGASIVDTDVIARDVVMPGQPAFAEIIERFGRAMLTSDGQLDRRALREVVFSDPQARADLEAITHPRIREQSHKAALQATGPYVVMVVPLLIESTRRIAVDRILVVDCEPATQLARLLARDGGTRSTAEAIIAAQTDRDTRLAAADDVIVNDSNEQDLTRAVDTLHRRYLILAAEHGNVAK